MRGSRTGKKKAYFVIGLPDVPHGLNEFNCAFLSVLSADKANDRTIAKPVTSSYLASVAFLKSIRIYSNSGHLDAFCATTQSKLAFVFGIDDDSIAAAQHTFVDIALTP